MKYFILNHDKRVRELIKEIISEQNDNIFEFEDINDAYDNLLNINPNFAFIDIEFKETGIDGLSITKKFLGKKPDLKIIIISEFDSEAFRWAAKKSGAFEFVVMDNLISLKSKLYSLAE